MMTNQMCFAGRKRKSCVGEPGLIKGFDGRG